MNKEQPEQTRREYSENQRTILLLFLAPVFLFLLPWFFVSLGARLDRSLGLTPILAATATTLLGLLLILVGFSLGLWSNYHLFFTGKGSPLPLMATQKLVVRPPYTYCRNPMALGTFAAYAGVGVLFHSYGALLLVLLLALLLLGYIKFVEEGGLERRFGQDYLDYKKQTPFLIPRFWKRR